ncbi:hypothetical protein J7E91_09140 [Streptomyces sp. ISL-99]|uniref:hypothetical protein n=1 Tax=Streptomyces sp. ISL-99 TaxID=2819193 RepID=UPI001BE72071|nr:hypothetical protein [Streptomyces sp. ISL-99]MBT2525594.1 hypothetical protein [Streptomyces sp. ISL-99]
MRHRMRIGPFQIGFGRRPVSPMDSSLSRERFTIDVAEGLMGIGVPFRRGCSALGFRVVVTDTETGRRQYVSENYTHDLAYADGEKYVTKLITGVKRVK